MLVRLYFYPRSPCGERRALACSAGSGCLFLSTLSLRRATTFLEVHYYVSYISIHALLAESDYIIRHAVNLHSISIHALLAESDTLIWDVIALITISIHALLAESDSVRPHTRQRDAISIHALLAESDGISSIINNVINNFYPRSPCGERQTKAKTNEDGYKFLSTLSLRRATDVIALITVAQSISIHALLAESDSVRPHTRQRDAISIHALLAESDV